MSRIGNRLIRIPENLSVLVNFDHVTITDSKRSLTIKYNNKLVKVSVDQNLIKTEQLKPNKESHAQQGTINSLLNNGIIGLTKGYKKVLTITGAGYRASINGDTLNLSLGYSHPIEMKIPAHVELKLVSPTEIHLNSFNKELLGEFAASIRK